MSRLSLDGTTVLGAGRWNVCLECGEGTHVNDTVARHHDGCSRRSMAGPPRQASRTDDPNLYVMTPNGIKRAMDVEKRRLRK